MTDNNRVLKDREKTILVWQLGVVIVTFILFLPAAFLSQYLSNGSIKYLFLFLSIPMIYIGVSSIRNQVSIIRLKGLKQPARGKLAIAGGLIAIAAVFIQLFIVFVPPVMNIFFEFLRNGFSGNSPQVYINLPAYNGTETATDFYRIMESPSFTEINTFKHISAWGREKAVPIAISDNTLIIAGIIQENEDTDRINVDLISANILTGKVNWQGLAGSGFIAIDSKQVYVETPNERFGGATGIMTYDINSGDIIWQTSLDYEYALGINYLAITEDNLSVESFHRSRGAFYILNKETGEKQMHKNSGGYIFMIDDETTYEWFGDSISASGKHQWRTELETNRGLYDSDLAAPIVVDNLFLVKNGHYTYSPVTAIDKSNGSVIWQIDKMTVSNLAVSGSVTYFVTEDAQLMAVNTQTGQVLGTVNFVPSFSNDFSFVNTSIFAAAHNDIVAVYFEDSRQLSVLRFNQIQ